MRPSSDQALKFFTSDSSFCLVSLLMSVIKILYVPCYIFIWVHMCDVMRFGINTGSITFKWSLTYPLKHSTFLHVKNFFYSMHLHACIHRLKSTSDILFLYSPPLFVDRTSLSDARDPWSLFLLPLVGHQPPKNLLSPASPLPGLLTGMYQPAQHFT